MIDVCYRTSTDHDKKTAAIFIEGHYILERWWRHIKALYDHWPDSKSTGCMYRRGQEKRSKGTRYASAQLT